MPDEIDLSPDEEEALDRVWARFDEQARLEELGQGSPRWGLDRARHERPGLSRAEALKWVRVANDEYRRLRMERVAPSVADSQSLQVANQRFPTGPGGRAEPLRMTPGQKAALTRKRRAAAAKAAQTRKRRTAAAKAARTRKLRAAGAKAALTRKRRAAARKAWQSRRSKAPRAKSKPKSAGVAASDPIADAATASEKQVSPVQSRAGSKRVKSSRQEQSRTPNGAGARTDQIVVADLGLEGGGATIFGRMVDGRWVFWQTGSRMATDGDENEELLSWRLTDNVDLGTVLPDIWPAMHPITIHQDFVGWFREQYSTAYERLPEWMRESETRHLTEPWQRIFWSSQETAAFVPTKPGGHSESQASEE